MATNYALMGAAAGGLRGIGEGIDRKFQYDMMQQRQAKLDALEKRKLDITERHYNATNADKATAAVDKWRTKTEDDFNKVLSRLNPKLTADDIKEIRESYDPMTHGADFGAYLQSSTVNLLDQMGMKKDGKPLTEDELSDLVARQLGQWERDRLRSYNALSQRYGEDHIQPITGMDLLDMVQFTGYEFSNAPTGDPGAGTGTDGDKGEAGDAGGGGSDDSLMPNPPVPSAGAGMNLPPNNPITGNTLSGGGTGTTGAPDWSWAEGVRGAVADWWTGNRDQAVADGSIVGSGGPITGPVAGEGAVGPASSVPNLLDPFNIGHQR